MIDENLIFIILITIFTVFIVRKQPYLVGTIILVIIFYYFYKNRFTNPKEFFSFIINKTQEAFEPCSAGNLAYCSSSDNGTTNSDMTFLPEIMRSMVPNKSNSINNMGSVVLRAEDYQIDRRLKNGIALITIDEMIKAIPILLDYKLYLEKVIKFILAIQTDDQIQQDFLAKKICSKMTKLFYNAYNTVNDTNYPINTYNELLYAEREFDDTLNIFVFLAMNDKDTKKLESLQKEFKDLNYKLNEFVIEKVNDILPNDYNTTTSFLPHKDEPQGINKLDNYINL